jgi:hypothetical protein
MSVPMGATLRVLVRAAGLVGAALTCWSNNVKWGTGAGRGGPPAQWERAAVGAALLSLLAALAVWLATRPGGGASRLWLRVAAVACALGVAAVALDLRSQAGRMKLPDLVEGPGWMWMAAGAGVALAAAAGTFALRGGAVAGGGASQRSRGRRRAAGQRGR